MDSNTIDIQERIKKIIEALNKNIYEKEEVIALAFLTAIAGESIFLLGPPGVGKSLIARKIKGVFKDVKTFEYLMNRFSTPDEIFGPISIKKLKDEDKYERITTCYLPDAGVIFLDEIWKAGHSIQNALLTVLNEKIYRNGDNEVKLDIRLIIAASNELPEQNQGLEALWDRFLIRYIVDRIESVSRFNEMISQTSENYSIDIDEELTIKDIEYKQWSAKIAEIDIPNEVLNVINIIRHHLIEENIYISDRRWKKIIKILRTSAFLNNRKQTDLMDCFLIAHCIWNEVHQIEQVREIVINAIRKHGYSLETKTNSIRHEIKDFETEVNDETKLPKTYMETIPKLYQNQYYKISGLEQFQIYYVLQSEADVLTVQDDNPVTGYNLSKQQVRKLYCKKIDETSFEVNTNFHIDQYRYDSHNFKMYEKQLKYEVVTIECEKIKKDQETTKKPNPRLIKEWDKHVDNIKSKIANETGIIENYRQTHLHSLQNNLFVNKKLGMFIEENLIETLEELKKLTVQIEKIRYFYENIK